MRDVTIILNSLRIKYHIRTKEAFKTSTLNNVC